MRVLIAPDAFKGSLTAEEAAEAMAEGLISVRRDLTIELQPMADGGEGTLDVLAPHLGGTRVQQRLPGMDGHALEATVIACERQGMPCWFIESARVLGLNLPSVQAMPFAARSSAPLGELMRQGLDQGVQRFEIALGGSGVHDGGMGMLHALGARYFDARGRELPPRLEAAERIATVDVSGLPRACCGRVLLDVDNPLEGEIGALAYARQKGADPRMFPLLDGWMRRWADAIERALERQARMLPGAGAAGGLGFALMLLGLKGTPGAVHVAECVGLEARIQGCDWVVTGEGRADGQTLCGKAPSVVAEIARRNGVRAALIAGRICDGTKLATTFDAMVAAAPPDMPEDQARRNARRLLADAAARLAHQHWS